MNLTKLFEMQKELDERINREHPPEPGEDRLVKKILALQVELGECANEWRGFKFWSNDQEPKLKKWMECPACGGAGRLRAANWPASMSTPVDCYKCRGQAGKYANPLLEEYVDCLHFILSIGLEINAIHWFDVIKSYELDSITDQFNRIFDKVGDFGRFRTHGNYEAIFDLFAGLGLMLGFTWEQIESAYSSKHQINLERQATGY